MAAPVAEEPNSLPPNSDLCLIPHRSPPLSADTDFTISQLIRPNASHPNPPPPSPVTSSLGKRRKSKPMKYGAYTDISEKTRSPLQHNTGIEDPLSPQNGNSATKHVKSNNKSPAVMVKAKEVQSRLGSENPSYIKLVKANVDTGYWMGFSTWFGKLFLPKSDSEMEVEDEDGEIHQIKYLADKTGLSAGWKKFAAGHNLVEGDVLVFHLVEAYKFKVYIVRANDLNKVDGALTLINSEAHTGQVIPVTETPPLSTKKYKRAKSLSTTKASASYRKEQSGNNSEEMGSEVLEGSRPSKPNLSLQELKNFKDFHIMVKGVCIDSELPDDVRMGYFKLCMNRKEFLHDCLAEKQHYIKLVAGMIGETVNIANEIKNCKLTTTKEEFDAWDTSLKCFSQLGMKVEFLRDRIHTLSKLVFESEDIERYVEAKKEQEHVDDEIKRLTEELKKLKESSRKNKGVVDALKEKAEKYEVKLQEEVNAPW